MEPATLTPTICTMDWIRPSPHSACGSGVGRVGGRVKLVSPVGEAGTHQTPIERGNRGKHRHRTATSHCHIHTLTLSGRRGIALLRLLNPPPAAQGSAQTPRRCAPAPGTHCPQSWRPAECSRGGRGGVHGSAEQATPHSLHTGKSHSPAGAPRAPTSASTCTHCCKHTHLVLQQGDEDGRCAGGRVGVLAGQAAAHVGGSGHRNALHAGLWKEGMGEQSGRVRNVWCGGHRHVLKGMVRAADFQGQPHRLSLEGLSLPGRSLHMTARPPARRCAAGWMGGRG